MPRTNNGSKVSRLIRSQSGKLYEIVHTESPYKARELKGGHKSSSKHSHGKSSHRHKSTGSKIHHHREAPEQSTAAEGQVVQNVQEANDNMLLSNAADNLLTEEQMKAKTLKELEKNYKKSRAFCKWYDKNIKAKKRDSWPVWKKADKQMTDAAACFRKCQGLANAKNIDSKSPLANAITKLRQSGEASFKTSLEMIKTLSEEDREKFWKLQERNKDANTFEELVTKKSWEQKKLLQETNGVATQAVAINSALQSAPAAAEADDQQEDASESMVM